MLVISPLLRRISDLTTGSAAVSFAFAMRSGSFRIIFDFPVALRYAASSTWWSKGFLWRSSLLQDLARTRARGLDATLALAQC